MTWSGPIYAEILKVSTPISETFIHELREQYGFEFERHDSEVSVYFSRTKANASLLSDSVIHLRKSKFGRSKVGS